MLPFWSVKYWGFKNICDLKFERGLLMNWFQEKVIVLGMEGFVNGCIG